MGLPERRANTPTPGTAAALTTLSANITTTSATSMTVNAAAPAALQGTGQTRIMVGTEIMIVDTSTMNGTTWTILTRGAEGSTAATHNSGDNVWHIWTADSASNFPVSTNQKATAARGYLSAASQNIASGTTAKVLWDAASYDIGSNMDVVTNHRYTAPAAGYYLITAAVLMTAAVLFSVNIYKNGTLWSPNGSATAWALLAGDQVQLAAADYVEIFVTNSQGAQITINGAGNSFWSVVRVA